MHNIKNSSLHFELDIPVGEMTSLEGNLTQDNNSTSNLQLITIQAAAAWALVILKDTVQSVVLPLENQLDPIILIIMTLTESEDVFMVIQGTMNLTLEYNTLEAVCMILARASTEL